MCGCQLTVCDHRHRRVFTLNGPVHVVCKLAIVLNGCAQPTPGPSVRNRDGPGYALVGLGLDVVCWLGQRRLARHWAVGQIRAELVDTYQIHVSDDAIERYIRRYQQMLAARQHDPAQLAAAYADVDAVSWPLMGSNPRKVMKRSLWCANWSANGSGLPRLCCPVRRPRSSGCSSRPAGGPSAWANRCGSGCRINKTRSCAGSRRSFQGCHTAIVRITSCGMWPSRYEKPTATPR